MDGPMDGPTDEQILQKRNDGKLSFKLEIDMSNDDVSNAGFWKRKRKRKRLAVSATSKFMGGIATSKITAVWGKRKRKRGSGSGRSSPKITTPKTLIEYK